MPSRAQYQDMNNQDADGHLVVHVTVPGTTSRWSHLENLDGFFRRVYEYHQRGGFFCMLLNDMLEVIEFLFVVFLATFLSSCIDYPVLFRNKFPSSWLNSSAVNAYTAKVTLGDVIVSNCANHLSGGVIFCLIVAGVFLAHRILRLVYHMAQYWEVRKFYVCALKINTKSLQNLTWHQIQQRLLEVQAEQQLCIQKRELNELDIYQRMLRYKNFLVALVNKDVLPTRVEFPFVGETVIFTNSLKFNLELLLFWGPWAPWENYWKLKPDYKRREKLHDLSSQMSHVILWMGLLNLFLSPLVLLWQVLHSFCQYAELIKREPSFLGSRRWSIYGRYYLRHFNELDHELDMRLNRAYRPAAAYTELFTSPFIVIVARHCMFFTGALLAILLCLAAFDQDVIQVEHMVTLMTGLGILFAFSRAFVPDENLVFCPEFLLTQVLLHCHYFPDSWRQHAHTLRVRYEFATLFQLKAVFLLEELLSPLITPFVLLFWLRPRASALVAFFHNFTVEVPGLGDVCSFAQMDPQKHGNAKWQVATSPPAADEFAQAEHGKTELSLVHFTITNPAWAPPSPAARFLNTFHQNAAQDVQKLQQYQNAVDNPLFQSLSSIGVIGGVPTLPALEARGNFMPSMIGSIRPHLGDFGSSRRNAELRGPAVVKSEGPLPPDRQSGGLASSLQESGQASFGTGAVDAATEMSLSVLYLHQLHQKRLRPQKYGALEELTEFPPASVGIHDLWTVPESKEREESAPQVFRST